MENALNEPKIVSTRSPSLRAIAYYRTSVNDRQENSIAIQKDQVCHWAREHGVEIIHEFIDIGQAGVESNERPDFTAMIEEWIKPRSDFDYVLCLDASRWGRLQGTEPTAHPGEICKSHNKQLIYTSVG